jgi:hypothetical protein
MLLWILRLLWLKFKSAIIKLSTTYLFTKLPSQKVVDSLKNCRNQIQNNGNQNWSQLMLIHMETEGKHKVKSCSSAHHEDTQRDLHGSHHGVFITKQTTFIQSNTTQVYFTSNGYLYMYASLDSCTDWWNNTDW